MPSAPGPPVPKKTCQDSARIENGAISAPRRRAKRSPQRTGWGRGYMETQCSETHAANQAVSCRCSMSPTVNPRKSCNLQLQRPKSDKRLSHRKPENSDSEAASFITQKPNPVKLYDKQIDFFCRIFHVFKNHISFNVNDMCASSWKNESNSPICESLTDLSFCRCSES